ncbi:serine/threonine dehydratase [Glaciecola petra]|uniref:Serine/threonine dehydratase n=1 Tax=Glaciecola petra TaxID=3075602 RepID=A0ABU2ZWC3_9ALTE|nr:serine/threonine dehydratase [Aestuariibacter sp. P117]MDT0596546.1 serine/threonine dehydratase [Aestuariibacter sp. P117]
MIEFNDILQAHARIKSIVKHTEVVHSKLLNKWMGHEIFFKVECMQTTGAFKLRGASNFLAKLAEQESLPKHIVANSSGNHAQAVAFAAKQFNIPVTIYATSNISSIKAAATKHYGAELKLFDTRLQADSAVQEAASEKDVVWIPPFNHPDIIAGQGTACLEALQSIDNINAVFAPCGGGGLLSGTYVCAKHFDPQIKVIGAEPLAANDAAQSLRNGRIISLQQTPKTLADGAATPSVGHHTYEILQQLDGFYEVNETDIAYWTQWLHHLLKMHIEPTCAMTMQAVAEWLNDQVSPQRVMVIISGGNISATSMQNVWAHDHLTKLPSLGQTHLNNLSNK